MTVLLLDDRWPSLIPLEAYGRLGGRLEFTDEVPVTVRWNIDRLVAAEGPGVLVSTDDLDPRVRARVDAGEEVIVAESRRDPVRVAVRAMERACSIGEWEASQTHRSLLPYLAEEAQEFADQVVVWEGDGDDQALLKELGDVLLQVLFHAEIASRRAAFDFGDVAGSFVDKLRSRSPYLFDGTTRVVAVEEQERLWALGKSRE
ncbi:XTP/dITP diphosphohydrolase [Corynebacterium pollutisoli]|uniref:Nucleoside triphosphate hydrolase n=1 Tax=Corynebacterium pollutisoli TaxID=1610489 RepID=A0A1X7K5A2_9CORY|nr:MazG nucleotide pyrophosphohydrolase domain-containing protein [Corynebacterium pollutisoli]NLP39496.1 nucleoside triphosphate hydrolase [Corynebacterium pollutisoli]SMG35789.1 XTP/dITP diphosphohydrolase [Corynebacterium pollutisoli]HJD78914.1 nucleoside triphosphate hydrolase [Corynebacterium pollutisoli]